MFLCLGFAQAAIHLYYDYDRIELAASVPDQKPGLKAGNARSPSTKVKEAIPRMVQKSIFRAGVITVAGTIFYALFLRQTVYSWAFSVVRSLYSLANVTRPSRFPGLADLMGRFTVESFLLIYLWEFSNVAFSAYVAQEPMKKGRPLTDDSKDPNGSLLLGLKSRKGIPKVWSLVR